MPADRSTRKAAKEKVTPYTGSGRKNIKPDTSAPGEGNTSPSNEPPATKAPAKRGRKPSAPANHPPESDKAPEGAGDQAATSLTDSRGDKTGHGRGTGRGRGRGRIGEATRLTEQPQATRPSRDPLPDRAVRNIHPAGKPKARRSQQEIEAEREAEMKALEEKIREGQLEKDRFAQLNAMEDQEEENLPLINPQRLSTAIHKWRHLTPDTDSGEDFNFDKVEDCSAASGSEEDEVAGKVAKLKATKQQKGKKWVKGATRQELLARTEEIRRGEHGGSQECKKQKGEVARFTTHDLAPKQYTNSGLRPQAIVPSQVEETEDIDSFKHGGLHDEDVEDDRPVFVASEGTVQAKPGVNIKPGHDFSRKNELVGVGEETSTIAAVKKQTVSKQSKIEAKKLTVVKPGISPDSAAQLHDEVLRQCLGDTRWIKVFLPTLTHALYVSCQPFTDWTAESVTLVETVQNVFNLSFTNVSLILTPKDEIVKTAYAWMKSRRSKLATAVLASVKAFFEEAEFKGHPDKIKEYVHWALRSGGPAYYETPVPKASLLRKDDPDCPKPDGFLRSRFIFPIAETYLGYAENSVLRPSLGPKHPPKGLYAMILTAVERAMKAHMNGVFAAPGDFNHQTVWNPMKDFFGILNRMSESRWALALEFTGDDDEDDLRANESILSAYRADFYLPPSPMKPQH